MSHPWMPFYVADYLGKTQRLTTPEHGAYVLLILEYWQSGGLPDDDDQLARICRLTAREWRRIRTTIQSFFYDGWHHHRIEQELAKADTKHDRRVASGKRGGIAKAAAKQTPSKPPSNATSNATSNALASSSQPQSEKNISPPSEAPPSSSAGPIRDAIELYNAAARDVGWAAVQQITKPRSTAMRSRLVDCGGLAGWSAALDRAKASPFLTGDNDRGWKADFDFLTKPKNLTKLMEGGYDRTAPGKTNGHGSAEPANNALLREIARQFAPEPGNGGGAAGADAGFFDQPEGTRGDPSPPLDIPPTAYRRTG